MILLLFDSPNLDNFSNFLIYSILFLLILNLSILLLPLFFLETDLLLLFLLKVDLLPLFLPRADLLNDLIIFSIKISRAVILLKP